MWRGKGSSRTALLAVGLLAMGLAGEPVAVAGAQSGDPPAPQLPCDVTVRIMPLGDSITVGSSSEVSEASKMISYRKDLWDSLLTAGYNVDFVGSQTNGQDYAGFDPNHEGHPGWGANNIRDNVYSFLFNLPQPARIVLLHIGTNDIYGSPQTPQEVVNEVEQILDNIDLYEQNTGNPVTVLLARIILRVEDSTKWIDFNNKLQQMADARIAAGDGLIVVNQETGASLVYKRSTDGGDMYWNGKNTLHPFHTGYTKMAAVWKAALDPLLEVCNHPPVITPDPGQQENAEGDLVSLQMAASDPDADQTLTFSATNLPVGLSIDESGLVGGTIDCNAAIDSPYPVTIIVHDNGQPQLEDSISFSWTVAAANCPPQVVTLANQNNSEGEDVSLQVSASDPDGPEILTFTAQGLPPGLSISAGGLVSGILSYEASAGSPYTVKVTATDPGGKSAAASFQWNVQNTNRSPSLQPVPDQRNDEQDTVKLGLKASDPDQDALQYSLKGQPPGLFVGAGTGLVQGKIACGAAGSYQVTAKVTDGALSASQTFSWQVLPSNCVQRVEKVFIPLLLNH